MPHAGIHTTGLRFVTMFYVCVSVCFRWVFFSGGAKGGGVGRLLRAAPLQWRQFRAEM